MLLRPMRRHRKAGFTLIELMITIAVLALLLLLAVPAFSKWIADASVRSVAESLQNSLRLAQATAVSRSRTTMFALTGVAPAWNATASKTGSNWYSVVLPLSESDETASSGSYLQGSSVGTQNGVSITGPAQVCFNALGRQAAKSATYSSLSVSCTDVPTDDTTDPTEYIVSRTNARTLVVRVYLGGRVRMCDSMKTLSNTDPDGC